MVAITGTAGTTAVMAAMGAGITVVIRAAVPEVVATRVVAVVTAAAAIGKMEHQPGGESAVAVSADAVSSGVGFLQPPVPPHLP